MGETFGVPLEAEATLCVLGYRREREEKKTTTVALLRCLFQARKLIMTRWQAITPPAIREWFGAVNETICKERAVYTKRGDLKEFEEMWRPWLEKMGAPL